MTTVVLGSASPSRLQILRSGGIEPFVLVSTADENELKHQLPAGPTLVEQLAAAKAADVAHQLCISHPTVAADALVIGCDSMLLTATGELVGKPLTVERTIAHWQQVRGTSAELLTGHTVIRLTDGTEATASAVTRTVVHFGTPTDDDIRRYAESGEPLYCAGAFTLEALGGWFIDAIEGDPSNVIGLSLPTLRRLAAQVGLNATSLWNTVTSPSAEEK